MNILLDLIILAIIAVTALLSAKRGFVRSAVELVGFLAAVWLAFTVSTPLAEMTYDKFLEPKIVSSVSDEVGTTAESIIDSTWNSLPEFVKNNADSIGLSRDKLSQNISQEITSGSENAVKATSQNAIKPVISHLLGLLYSVIILIVAMILVRLAARLLNKLFSFSIVGKLNRILGGVFGIAKGIIIAILFCMIISLILSFNENGFLIFNKEITDNSYLFSKLCLFNKVI